MTIKDKTDELWDVYTKDRELTGRTHQRGLPLAENDYHLVVHVCIFNSKGEMLIQKRQPFKKGWTNMWDISVGGSAVSGDNSQQAAEREVLEELGLKIDLSDVRPVFTMNFAEGFDDYYIVEMDVDVSKLNLQYEEVSEVRFAGKEEVLRMCDEGVMIPYWFLGQLFDIRKNYDAHGEINPPIRVQQMELCNVDSAMSMFEIIQYCSKQKIDGRETFRRILVKAINDGNVVCALRRNIVIGLKIYKKCVLRCMLVHPEYEKYDVEKILKSY